jgi:hypothetical protein
MTSSATAEIRSSLPGIAAEARQDLQTDGWEPLPSFSGRTESIIIGQDSDGRKDYRGKQEKRSTKVGRKRGMQTADQITLIRDGTRPERGVGRGY